MSKRNFTLLIIILIIGALAVLGYLYFHKKPPTDNGIGTNFFSQFNPFKTNTTTNPPVVTPPVDVSEYQPPDDQQIQTEKLKKVSTIPIAGYGVFQKERLRDVQIIQPVVPPAETTGPGTKKKTVPTPPLTEFVPALRYVERATGNVYQTFADKIEERKFSTTVIPKVYEASFGSLAESVLMRYLKADGQTIVTFLGNLPKEYIGADTTGDNEVVGSFLSENVTDVSLSPDGQKIFYLLNIGDSAIGTISNLSGAQASKKNQIFESPFTEWISQWPNNKIITLTTKASSSVPGYVYMINAENKNFNKVFGGINGLTTLTSPNGKLILYSNNNLSLSVYNTDTRVSQTLGIKTLPEKCVWSNGSIAVYCAVPRALENVQYPDAWYQGDVSFSDQIWKVDIQSGNTSMLTDPLSTTVSGSEDIDGIKLAIDQSENYLFFVNKKDSFLWEFNLK